MSGVSLSEGTAHIPHCAQGPAHPAYYYQKHTANGPNRGISSVLMRLFMQLLVQMQLTLSSLSPEDRRQDQDVDTLTVLAPCSLFTGPPAKQSAIVSENSGS